MEDLQGCRIVGDGELVAGSEHLEGNERIAREGAEGEGGRRAANHQDRPAPQQRDRRGSLGVNRKRPAHPKHDDAHRQIEDDGNEEEGRGGEQLGGDVPIGSDPFEEGDGAGDDR